MDITIELAKNQAKRDFANGLGHNDNPYKKGTAEQVAWMMEIGKLQLEEFKAELAELECGI